MLSNLKTLALALSLLTPLSAAANCRLEVQSPDPEALLFFIRPFLIAKGYRGAVETGSHPTRFVLNAFEIVTKDGRPRTHYRWRDRTNGNSFSWIGALAPSRFPNCSTALKAGTKGHPTQSQLLEKLSGVFLKENGQAFELASFLKLKNLTDFVPSGLNTERRLTSLSDGSIQLRVSVSRNGAPNWLYSALYVNQDKFTLLPDGETLIHDRMIGPTKNSDGSIDFRTRYRHRTVYHRAHKDESSTYFEVPAAGWVDTATH